MRASTRWSTGSPAAATDSSIVSSHTHQRTTQHKSCTLWFPPAPGHERWRGRRERLPMLAEACRCWRWCWCWRRINRSSAGSRPTHRTAVPQRRPRCCRRLCMARGGPTRLRRPAARLVAEARGHSLPLRPSATARVSTPWWVTTCLFAPTDRLLPHPYGAAASALFT